MTIINGVEDRGRVESLLELDDLVELTPDGFRAARASTIESIAARLRGDPEEQQPWLAGLDCDPCW